MMIGSPSGFGWMNVGCGGESIGFWAVLDTDSDICDEVVLVLVGLDGCWERGSAEVSTAAVFMMTAALAEDEEVATAVGSGDEYGYVLVSCVSLEDIMVGVVISVL